MELLSHAQHQDWWRKERLPQVFEGREGCVGWLL